MHLSEKRRVGKAFQMYPMIVILSVIQSDSSDGNPTKGERVWHELER